jgi:hypothetical protein
VGAHVRDGGGLAGRSGGGRRCGSSRLTRGVEGDESAADLVGDAELAASEGPRPGDRVTGAAVAGSFRLEDSQHPFRAIRRPHSDDPPIGFA